MREKGSVLLSVLVVLLLVIVGVAGAGYYYFIYPVKQFEKARTPDTNLNTEPTILPPKTSIKEKGLNSTMVISPSQNDVISGEVVIEATDLPAETKHVGFSVSEKFEDLGVGGPNLGFDSDGSDGWGKTLDTSNYENGIYYVALFVFENDASSNPLGAVNKQVEIRN
jgi:hypothetical protein